jgi:hypothetical protein
MQRLSLVARPAAADRRRRAAPYSCTGNITAPLQCLSAGVSAQTLHLLAWPRQHSRQPLNAVCSVSAAASKSVAGCCCELQMADARCAQPSRGRTSPPGLSTRARRDDSRLLNAANENITPSLLEKTGDCSLCGVVSRSRVDVYGERKRAAFFGTRLQALAPSRVSSQLASASRQATLCICCTLTVSHTTNLDGTTTIR